MAVKGVRDGAILILVEPDHDLGEVHEQEEEYIDDQQFQVFASRFTCLAAASVDPSDDG